MSQEIARQRGAIDGSVWVGAQGARVSEVSLFLLDATSRFQSSQAHKPDASGRPRALMTTRGSDATPGAPVRLSGLEAQDMCRGIPTVILWFWVTRSRYNRHQTGNVGCVWSYFTTD